MADKDASKEAKAGWTLARRFSVVYGLATTVGFFYASAYFGHFGIDILNFVAPIDLLFISLEHIDRVVLIAIVLMPVTLVFLVVGVPTAVLLILSIVMAVVTLAAAVLFSLFALVISLLIALSASVYAPAIRLFWLKKAFSAVHTDRAQRPKKAQAIESKNATQDSDVKRTRTLTLAAAYRSAKSEGHTLLDPKALLVKEANKILGLVPKTWAWAISVLETTWSMPKNAKDWLKRSYVGTTTVPASEEEIDEGERGSPAPKGRVRLKPWDELFWPQRFTAIGLGLLLLATLIVAATRVGDVDAAILEENAPDCQLDVLDWKFDLPCYSGRVIFPTMARPASAKDGLRQILGPKEVHPVYSIPNTNLASLEFSNCGGLTGGHSRQYARPHFRHDAGDDARRSTPDCLVYLGATGSIQFLAQLDSGSRTKRKQRGSDQTVVVAYPPTSGIVIVDNAGTREVLAGASDCKKVAVVGPFGEGSSTLGECASESCSTSEEFGLCEPYAETALSSMGALKNWIANLEGQRQKRPERLVLVGRVDSLPIYTENYRSNFALAQARADWVREQLASADWAKNAHVMSVPGGPADHENQDPCDRIVEVHMCWAPRGDEPAGAVGDAGGGGNGNSTFHESNGDGA